MYFHNFISSEQDKSSSLCNIPGKVDRLNILKLDKNSRLVDEQDVHLQWADESRSRLVGAGNSRGAKNFGPKCPMKLPGNVIFQFTRAIITLDTS